jgi:hypothetical protein
MSTDLDRAVRDAIGDILDLAPTAPDQPTDAHRTTAHRGAWWAGAAAAVVIVAGVGGLIAMQRPTSDAPVEQPAASIPTAQVAPEGFPSFPAGDPRNVGAVGAYSQFDPAALPQVSAGIVRRDGDRLVDGIIVTAYAQLPADLASGSASTPVTVGGETLDAYTDGGTPAITTVVVPNAGIPVTVAGVDPAAFLNAAGLGFVDAKFGTGPGGRVVLDVKSLPPGYEQLDPPTSFPAGARQASLHVPTVGNADGAAIFVELMPAAAQWAVVAPLAPVDINGAAGWASDAPGHAVTWQIGGHTWATVAGVDTTDEALAIARDVRFVDEATWRTTYNVTDPNFPTTAETPSAITAPATTAVVSPAASFGAPPRFLLGADWQLSYYNETGPGAGDFEFTSTAPGADVTLGSTVITAADGDVLAAEVTQPAGVIQGMWTPYDRANDLDPATVGTSAAGFPTEDTATTVAGHPTRIFQNAPDDYTAVIDIGDGSIELRAAGTTRDEFDAVLATVHPVTIEEFDAALPGSVVTPQQRSEVVAEMTADIPLPDGIDTVALVDQQLYSGRVNLATSVAQLAVCGWLDQWFDTKDTDTGRRDQALEALEASHQWTVLTDLDPRQSGYPSAVWEIVDTLRAGGTVASGGGPIPITRSNAASSLDCSW